MQKAPYVFPVVGGRKVEQLHANIEALSVSLSDQQIAYLESILPFDKGFPMNRFVSIVVRSVSSEPLMIYTLDYRAMAQIIIRSSRPRGRLTSGLHNSPYGLSQNSLIVSISSVHTAPIQRLK